MRASLALAVLIALAALAPVAHASGPRQAASSAARITSPSITTARESAPSSTRSAAETGVVGFYYFRLRYLDPAQGRFVNRDPIGVWGDASNLGNGYSFCGNDPVNFVDPFGLDAIGWIFGKVGQVVDFVTGGVRPENQADWFQNGAGFNQSDTPWLSPPEGGEEAPPLPLGSGGGQFIGGMAVGTGLGYLGAKFPLVALLIYSSTQVESSDDPDADDVFIIAVLGKTPGLPSGGRSGPTGGRFGTVGAGGAKGGAGAPPPAIAEVVSAVKGTPKECARGSIALNNGLQTGTATAIRHGGRMKGTTLFSRLRVRLKASRVSTPDSLADDLATATKAGDVGVVWGQQAGNPSQHIFNFINYKGKIYFLDTTRPGGVINPTDFTWVRGLLNWFRTGTHWSGF